MAILTEEQIAELKATANRKEARAKNKAKKQRDQRAEEKEVRDATPEIFWKRNRDVANQAQITSLLERQEYVFALLEDIRTVIEGRAPDVEFATDVEEEIKADVGEHGICQMEVVLLEFWKSPNTLAMLTLRGDATSTFARYGLAIAIPGHRLHEWESWLRSQKTSKPQSL